MILPVDEYLPGAVLPPHLSPFVEETEGGYVPPEKKRLINMKLGISDEQVNESAKPKETSNKQSSANKGEKANKTNTATDLHANGNGKKHHEETKLKKTEKRKNEESDEDENEENELLNDMKVDLDSPDEEQSEEESEDFSDDEAATNAIKKQVILIFYF
jgi:pescadillo protein